MPATDEGNDLRRSGFQAKEVLEWHPAATNDLKGGRARGTKAVSATSGDVEGKIGYLHRFITVEFACVCLVPRFVSGRGSLPKWAAMP